jgi:hypothetical protein
MSNSDLIATAALLVAGLAMGATFWQAHVARAYGRISVRPHLDWGTNRFPGKPIVLYLLNSGLGPAIIDSLTLTLDGKSFPIDGLDLPPELRNEVISISGHTEWNLFSKGTPIANGAQINLFFFENSSLGLVPHNQAVALLNRIGVEIHYSSMYGEKFVLRRVVATNTST